MPTRALTLVAGLVCVASAHAQGGAAPAKPDSNSVQTTLAGVFTAEQVAKGKEIDAAACLSCHKASEHMGGPFWKDLVDKSIYSFFDYLKSNMPQDNPGSLSDDDYVNVIAYIFSLNSLPTGPKPLPADTAVLKRIIVKSDTTKKGP